MHGNHSEINKITPGTILVIQHDMGLLQLAQITKFIHLFGLELIVYVSIFKITFTKTDSIVQGDI